MEHSKPIELEIVRDCRKTWYHTFNGTGNTTTGVNQPKLQHRVQIATGSRCKYLFNTGRGSLKDWNRDGSECSQAQSGRPERLLTTQTSADFSLINIA